jgi:hypothetical protein
LIISFTSACNVGRQIPVGFSVEPDPLYPLARSEIINATEHLVEEISPKERSGKLSNEPSMLWSSPKKSALSEY